MGVYHTVRAVSNETIVVLGLVLREEAGRLFIIHHAKITSHKLQSSSTE